MSISPGNALRMPVFEACQAIQHALLKPSLVNLISKDPNLVFYLLVYLKLVIMTLFSIFVLIQRH